MKLQLKFRSVEYHTIEREVPDADFEEHKDRDICAWLDEKFRDDQMSDSDFETVEFELLEWGKVEPAVSGDEANEHKPRTGF